MEALPTEKPPTYWMRKLLAQVKRDHLGEGPAVQARFKRAFTKGGVIFYNEEWQLNIQTQDCTPLSLDSYPEEEDALHDMDPESLEAPLSPLSPEHTSEGQKRNQPDLQVAVLSRQQESGQQWFQHICRQDHPMWCFAYHQGDYEVLHTQDES
jgi:hypothetical protein